MLNTSMSIGWKWAQREDAEWMLNDYVEHVDCGNVWGIDKKWL